MDGDGAFPPRALCVCGCFGFMHSTRWDGDRFVGTRCPAHGGHKFAPKKPASTVGGE